MTKIKKQIQKLLETKSAPKGFHFTKDGKLKRGDADRDGSGGPMLRSDPLDKQRSKVPPVSEAVSVKKANYSWGKMVTVHHGSDTSYPLHPEHQAAIKKLKSGESTSFTDETNRKVTASREGDQVHLSGRGSNKKTTVAHSHFAEGNMSLFKQFRTQLEEKTLTPAEKKKREEVAKAIERENPNMPMGMKMAIATKTAKRVAEDLDEVNNITDTAASARSKIFSSSKNRLRALYKNAHPAGAKRMSEEEELDEANEYHKIAVKHLNDMMKKDATPAQKDYARKMNKRALEAAKMSDPEAAKKHYMGVNEEVEQVDEVSKKTAVSYIQKKVSQIAKRPGEAMLYTTKMDNKDYTNLKRAYKRAGVKEEVKDEYARKVDKYLKKKYNKEEFELGEATQFPSKEHAISYAKEKVKSHKDSDDGIEVYSMPGGGARVIHTMNSQGRQQVLKGGGKKVTTVTREQVEQASEGEHYCAKHVYSNVHGEGTVLEGMHAEPDENGNIEWYVVEFSAGPRKVFTEKLDIMIAEYHGNHKKKRMTNGR